MTSRGVLLLEVILIVIILIGITKEVVRRMSLRQEIATLEQQIAELQAQNRSLGEYVASINTDSFREREARKRLNLQRPGKRYSLCQKQIAHHSSQRKYCPKRPGRRMRNVGGTTFSLRILNPRLL